MRNKTLLLATLLVGGLAGCAGKSQEPPVPDAPVTIVVENQNFYDATIYLRWYGERRRLGTVTGYTTREFDTRWVGPQVQVEVDLLAGGTYRGDRISVSPGESLDVQIPPALDRYPAARTRGSGDN
jgi:hypothetical protein